jgi:hypothetical protein
MGVRKAHVHGMVRQYKVMHLELMDIKRRVSDFVEGWKKSKEKKKLQKKQQL